VWVAADQLVDETAKNVGHGEFADLRRDLGMKDDLKQQITELLHQVALVIALQGLHDLVRFFDQVGFQRSAGLFAIPGAAPWAAEPGHDLDEACEQGTRGVDHVRS
jgi:hypothetical protein